MSGSDLARKLPGLRVSTSGLNAALATLSGALLIALAYSVWMQPQGAWRFAALVVVGSGIGAALLLGNFGFASAFRNLVQWKDASGFQAHAVMIGLASLLMLPILAQGSLFGMKMAGEATPVGVGFALGAILFGIGMQIGGGCASGTLFALGGGNAKLVGTLAGFVIGSALGSWSMGFWWSLPALPGANLQDLIGFGPAIALQLVVIAALFLVARRHSSGPLPRSLVVAGIALAVLNAATLILNGKAWGETSAFALWGSMLFTNLGIDAHQWAYWLRPGFNAQLDKSLSLDVTSMMDAAILLGAVLAAAMSGLFRFRLGGGWMQWGAAILGGAAMGAGARMSNGCNIGAYFSAISVGNLSGWAWMLLAMLGSWIGVKARPLFSLDARVDIGPSC